MKTFYVFKLNKNYNDIAKKKPYNIYVLLNSIYTYKKGDVLVAFDLFKEMCLPINKDFFNKYYFERMKVFEEYTKFRNVHMYNNYLSGEVSKMTINNSHMIIKSNIDENIFMMNLIEDLFVCDFKNSTYLILNKNNTSKFK